MSPKCAAPGRPSICSSLSGRVKPEWVSSAWTSRSGCSSCTAPRSSRQPSWRRLTSRSCHAEVLAPCDEACGGELEHEYAVDLLVEGVRARPQRPVQRRWRHRAQLDEPRRRRAADVAEDARYCERRNTPGCASRPARTSRRPRRSSRAVRPPPPRRSVAGSPALPARHDAVALEEQDHEPHRVADAHLARDLRQEREAHRHRTGFRATSSPRRSRTGSDGRRHAVRRRRLRQDAHGDALHVQLLVAQPDRSGRHILGLLSVGGVRHFGRQEPETPLGGTARVDAPSGRYRRTRRALAPAHRS